MTLGMGNPGTVEKVSRSLSKRKKDADIAAGVLKMLPKCNLRFDSTAFRATCLSTRWTFTMVGFFQFTLCLCHDDLSYFEW